jgi:hypothetical protein
VVLPEPLGLSVLSSLNEPVIFSENTISVKEAGEVKGIFARFPLKGHAMERQG